MRKIISAVFAAGMLLAAGSATAGENNITIVIEDIKQNQGDIMLQLLSGRSEFDGDDPATGRFSIAAQSAELRIFASNLPAGDYALRVMHDVNGNGELDTNIVGMPIEPYAFSNNATGHFGPPNWEEVKFTISGSVVQNIQLVH